MQLNKNFSGTLRTSLGSNLLYIYPKGKLGEICGQSVILCACSVTLLAPVASWQQRINIILSATHQIFSIHLGNRIYVVCLFSRL